MNILILTESFPPHAGGSGWSTLALVQGLIKAGHQVTVAKINGKETRYQEIPIHIVHSRKDIAALVKEIQPDLIHAQHRLSTILAVGYNVPAITTIRDYWHLDYKGTLYSNHEDSGYAKQSWWQCLKDVFFNSNIGVKLLSPVVATYLHWRTSRSLQALKQLDGVICNSSHTYAQTKDYVNKKIAIIHNIIDLKKLGKIKAKQFDKPTIVFVGKLEEYKGAHVLYEAVKQLDSVQCIFIGEGYLRKKIEKQNKVAKKDTIFPGYLANDEVLSYVKGATVFVMPSLWHEPLSRTLLEGLGVGAVILTTPTGGTPDIINGKNGVYFDGTAEDCTEKLRYLLNNTRKRQTLRKEAVKSAQKFSEKKVIKQFETFYKEVVA